MRVSLGCHLLNAALPVPDLNHVQSQMEGTIKRIACTMPTPDRAKMRRLRRFVNKILNLNYKDKQFCYDESFDFDEFINDTPYTQKRKENLKQTHSTNFDPTKGYNVKAFVKDENYPEYKHFRGIMSRSDDYKVRVGPFFRKLSKIIFSNKHFIKKIPISQRPDWIMNQFYGATDVFCTDFSSFEATFGRLMMRVERMVYAWFLDKNKRRDEILKLIDRGIMSTNHMVYKWWKMSIECRRMSGEMNTSEGNGIMNLIMTLFLLGEQGNPVDLAAIFEGDDGLIQYETNTPSIQDYSDLGANIKIEIPDSISEASFCGLIFDPVAKDNVTDPVDLLMSFGYTTNQYRNASRFKLDALLRAKGFSMIYQYPGCPIIASLARYALRITNHIDDKYLMTTVGKQRECQYDKQIMMEALAHRHEVINKIVHINTRILVEKKYKITINMQYTIEKYLDQLNVLTPLSIPLIESLIHPHCHDYYTRYGTCNNTFLNPSSRDYKLFLNGRTGRFIMSS